MFRKNGTLLTLGLLAMLCGSGCGLQAGHSVITQNGRSDPVMSTAPDTGTYMLFTASSPNPTATAKVQRGEPLGFRRAADGHLVGVAGEQHFDLSPYVAQAYWKYQNPK